jgi:OPA family glycerol-3-phosphate transporter-like MFS transporter
VGDLDSHSAARLRRWQGVTVATLFVGYAGYYVCRSVLPVASNGMLNDPTLGLDEVGYGRLGAVGIYAYAVGKLLNGVATEYVGGRAMFLAGMVLSAACVVAFGLAGGLTAFLLIWAVNRFVQSGGWVALVRITGRWFRPESLATTMGVLSLSYLFGDALARLYLGTFAGAGLGWRELFFVAAGTLGVIAIVTAITLRASPTAIGLPEPPPPPGNVFGANDHGTTRVSLRQLLGPLLASRLFWLVCLMNAGLTAIRETFNYWTPRYLEKGIGLDSAYAGLLSFVFPFTGAMACLLAGWGADRLRGHYGRLIVPLMGLTTITLVMFVQLDLRDNGPLALTLIGAVALFLMGPYTFCSGVLALNLGGKRAGAATAGIVDAVGYLCGAIVSGEIAGRLVRAYGFDPLLEVLLGLAAATLLVAIVYWVCEERRRT